MKTFSAFSCGRLLTRAATVAFTCTLLALFVLLPSPAIARQPVSTPMTGTVRSVDVASRKIAFLQASGAVREFVWIRWAKFWHSATSCTTPTHLKPGMRVQISVHNPLFGPDYVTRIELLQPTKDAGSKSRK